MAFTDAALVSSNFPGTELRPPEYLDRAAYTPYQSIHGMSEIVHETGPFKVI